MQQTVAEGDWVACRFTARLTHSGPELGVAPTGRRIEVTGMSMTRFSGGKLVEGWNNWDQLTLMQQIQAGPPAVPLLR